ncbi:hypothetical protein [Clostridium sp.]|uniref:hypothetical protein n=1 Tax=Clostridium sp. TaxID=1506 RepID=UPI001D9F6A97|nr:hypothetical protein [Clostridium sp.]MBS5988029.1 hypothetical protein [Clostridium sp.]
MKKNKIGIGSLSLLLFIIGCLFSFTFNDICIGDSILTYIGLKAWSNGNSGTHYTIFYSILFFIPSLILGYKFKENFGSKIGKILSTIMVIMIIVNSLFFTAIL